MYLGKKDPGTAWSLKSRALAEGLALHEESINELGFPLREVYDPERDGWYEVDDKTIDYSQAALEDYRKATKNPEPGVQLKVVDTYKGEGDRPEEARRPPAPRGEEGLDAGSRHPVKGEEGLEAVVAGLAGIQDLSG